MAEIGGICELVLEADELEVLERFYGRLGLRVLAREPDCIWMAAGERSRLGLWSPGTKQHGDRGGRHVHFALSTARGTLERMAQKLRSEGVSVEGPIAHAGGDRSIYFADPAGNRVELWDFFCDGAGARQGVAALAEG